MNSEKVFHPRICFHLPEVGLCIADTHVPSACSSLCSIVSLKVAQRGERTSAVALFFNNFFFFLTFHFYNKAKSQDTWVCSAPCKPKAKVTSAGCLCGPPWQTMCGGSGPRQWCIGLWRKGFFSPPFVLFLQKLRQMSNWCPVHLKFA